MTTSTKALAHIHTFLQERTIRNSRRVELLLASLTILSIIVAIVLYHTNIDAFFWFTQEDGFIEYSTAFFLLATFFVCAVYTHNAKTKHHLTFYAIAAFAFFFGFGEEISWGQRIFHFSTPENIMQINAQNEFTVHNLEVYGISFKKMLFRTVLNSFVLAYFVAFPVLFRSKNWFRKLVEAYGIPVPTARQATLFLLSFMSVFLIDEGKKWELAELSISCFTFLAFTYSSNLKKQRLPNHNYSA